MVTVISKQEYFLWDQVLKLYQTLLVESLMIIQTMEEVKITVEAITMVETMHIISMVVEIIDIIAATLAEVQEYMEHSLI